MLLELWVRRLLISAIVLASGSTFATGGCSPQAIQALIIGLDAAADQIEEDQNDISFSDWLDSEFDDIFEDD